ncbi:MAG TPA: hypothetical protein VF487_19000 [Chitinophagaceae bacterium]
MQDEIPLTGFLEMFKENILLLSPIDGYEQERFIVDTPDFSHICKAHF